MFCVEDVEAGSFIDDMEAMLSNEGSDKTKQIKQLKQLRKVHHQASNRPTAPTANVIGHFPHRSAHHQRKTTVPFQEQGLRPAPLLRLYTSVDLR